METLTADEVLAAAARRLSERTECIQVMWMRSDDRSRMKEDLVSRRHTLPLVVHSMSEPLFENPNAIGNDLVRVLELEKTQVLECTTSDECLCVIVLSRVPLEIVDSSSPVELPSWFPFSSGQLVKAEIHEAFTCALEPLSGPNLKAQEVASALLQLECTLQRCLRRALDQRFADVEQWLQHLDSACSGKLKCRARLDKARDKYAACSLEDYRPRAQDGLLIEEMWDTVVRQSLRDRDSSAKKLARALWGAGDAISETPRESFITVVMRSTSWPQSSATRVANAIIGCNYAACQLVTVSHHASDYADYESALLRGVSFDMRRTLAELITFMDIHD